VVLPLAAVSVSFAQSKPTSAPKQPAQPAYTILRYDEDDAYLKDASKHTDFFDPIKYLPLGDDSYLSLGGQFRYRYEFFNNNFGVGPQDDNGYHLTRYQLHADLHVGDNFRFFVQGKSSMEDGRNGGPRPSDSDEADVQQVFADLILPVGEKKDLTLRGGRQVMSYGAQRLIAPSDWSNNLRAFEGGKAILASPNNSLDVFWVRPIIIENEEPNQGDGNTSFAGIYNTLALPDFMKGAGTKLEVYGLILNKTISPTTLFDSDTYTLGARLSGKTKPWDYDVEADYQFGQFDSERIWAYALAVEGGYTFADVKFSPRASLGFDIASGSADGSERFNQLFPSGHQYFGYIDVIGRQNIIDLHPGLQFKFTKDLGLRADYHIFWRQNTDDAVFNAQGNVLRPDLGSDAASIGSEIDLLLTWQINRHTLTSVGYSHFFAGTFIDQTGPHQDIDFFYMALTYTF